MNDEKQTVEYLSIFVGVLSGIFLSYFYETYLPMTNFNLQGLIVFLTIPSLIGFISGLIDKTHGTRNGVIIGLITGATNYFIFLAVTLEDQVKVEADFAFFAVMSIFMWMILAAAAGRLAKEYER